MDRQTDRQDRSTWLKSLLFQPWRGFFCCGEHHHQRELGEVRDLRVIVMMEGSQGRTQNRGLNRNYREMLLAGLLPHPVRLTFLDSHCRQWARLSRIGWQVRHCLTNAPKVQLRFLLITLGCGKLTVETDWEMLLPLQCLPHVHSTFHSLPALPLLRKSMHACFHDETWMNITCAQNSHLWIRKKFSICYLE